MENKYSCHNMTIRTEEELHARLDNELAWRKHELTYIKSLIDTSDRSVGRCNLRIGSAFLYAHWEGYIKFAARHYVTFLKNQNLKYSDLSDNFVTLALKTDFISCQQSRRSINHHAIVNKILNNFNDSACIPSEDTAIEAESNMNYMVLRNIVFSIGLDLSKYELKKQLIDRTLVDTRNHITHGEERGIDKESYDMLHDTIISLLDDFHMQILNAVQNKSYLRKKNS